MIEPVHERVTQVSQVELANSFATFFPNGEWKKWLRKIERRYKWKLWA